jgi:lysophospholipase L1-like esterase
VGTLGTVAPDLVSIELGLNDQGGGLTPSQTVINIRQLIAALRGLPTVPSIVLIIAYTPDASTGITQWADYVTAMRMLAVGDGMLTAIDLSASMPAATTAGTGYYRTDGLHPNDSGHALIALQFAAIVAPDASGRPQSYVPRRRAANW